MSTRLRVILAGFGGCLILVGLALAVTGVLTHGAISWSNIIELGQLRFGGLGVLVMLLGFSLVLLSMLTVHRERGAAPEAATALTDRTKVLVFLVLAILFLIDLLLLGLTDPQKSTRIVLAGLAGSIGFLLFMATLAVLFDRGRH